MRASSLVLAALLISSCGGVAVDCKSPRGMELVGELPMVSSKEPGAEGFNCATFDRAEDLILAVFARAEPATLKDPRFEGLGDRLAGYQVSIEPGEGWHNADGKGVNGETFCEDKRIKLADFSFLAGAFAHELSHVAQDCHARGPLGEDVIDGGVVPADIDHSNWHRDGVWATLTLVSQEEFRLYGGNPSCFDEHGTYVGPTDGGTCEATP